MIIIYYIIYLIVLRIYMFIIRILLYFKDQGIIIEWLLIRLNRINIEILLFFDWIRMLFVRIVIFISSIVLAYRIEYIMGNFFLIRYYYLVLLFVFSIILIILRPNIIRIIFGWDGLGLVSFCLVVFYQNYISYNSGILTVLINRFGDVIILIVIGIIIIYGRWNLFIVKKIKLLIIIIVIARITKRAQLPFSSWLPIAMAAPTPVSALVHSSTLVTAGVYLIIRFYKFLIINKINEILLFISILTIFISGLIANFEYDLKKIIALSTLRQLGLILIILRVGFPLLSFYHLLMHAIFKSLLFIRAGSIIHLIMNNQDIRIIGKLREYIPLSIIRLQLTLISLCGFPFFSGFYSKDLVIEIIYFIKLNLFIFRLRVVSLMFTIIYSFRLMFYIYFGENKVILLNFLYERKIIILSIFILIVLRIIIGAYINWLFFIDEWVFLIITKKLITLLLIMLGVVMFVILKIINLINIYNLRYFFRSIWFLNYLYFWLVCPFITLRNLIFKLDKRWMEFLRQNFFLQMYNKFNNYYLNNRYKIYIFLNLFIMVIIWRLINRYLSSLWKVLYWRYKENIIIFLNIYK